MSKIPLLRVLRASAVKTPNPSFQILVFNNWNDWNNWNGWNPRKAVLSRTRCQEIVDGSVNFRRPLRKRKMAGILEFQVL